MHNLLLIIVGIISFYIKLTLKSISYICNRMPHESNSLKQFKDTTLEKLLKK